MQQNLCLTDVQLDTVERELFPADPILNMMERNEKNQVKQTVDNCILALQEDPVLKGKIRFNELSGMMDIVGDVNWSRSWIPMDDIDHSHIIYRLEKVYGLSVDKKIDRALLIVADQNRYHPIREFLLSLKWDGQERVKHALHHFFGAEENEWSDVTLRIFMHGAVERIFHPGCKFEIMPCLVGHTQGTGKSTFFRFLAIKDEWFTDDIKHLDDERICQKFQGHWIIELPEMLAAIKAKNVEDIKSFLSRQSDVFRTPYDKFPKDRPRQCVFAGTSNRKQFLPADHSGNRRLIPIEVHEERAEVHILDDEKEARDYILQMWAEIMEEHLNGNYRLTLPKHLQKELSKYQSDFMPDDFDADAIYRYLDNIGDDYVCVLMIFHNALGNPSTERPQQWQSRAISEIMDAHPGWERSSTHRYPIIGIQKSWVRKEKRNGFRPVNEEEDDLPFK